MELTKLESNVRGVVGIFKPQGMTSHDVVNRVRKVTGERRVGHAGTLDPLAKGVLVVGIGREGTKLLGVMEKSDKEYQAIIKFGETSTTDDEEGVKKNSIFKSQMPNLMMIEETIGQFIGEIWQVPPLYSAVKIQGQEAYKLARKGKEVKMEPRLREVKVIEIVKYEWPVLKLRVVTGPGVYIRSLARDLGERLGVGGYLTDLIRLRVGEFGLKDCFLTDGVESVFDK